MPRIGQDAKDLDANLTQRGEGDDRLKLNADDVLRNVLSPGGRIDQVLRCHSIVLLSVSLQAAGIPDSSVTS